MWQQPANHAMVNRGRSNIFMSVKHTFFFKEKRKVSLLLLLASSSNLVRTRSTVKKSWSHSKRHTLLFFSSQRHRYINCKEAGVWRINRRRASKGRMRCPSVEASEEPPLLASLCAPFARSEKHVALCASVSWAAKWNVTIRDIFVPNGAMIASNVTRVPSPKSAYHPLSVIIMGSRSTHTYLWYLTDIINCVLEVASYSHTPVSYNYFRGNVVLA